jgi:hypothetical protein
MRPRTVPLQQLLELHLRLAEEHLHSILKLAPLLIDQDKQVDLVLYDVLKAYDLLFPK